MNIALCFSGKLGDWKESRDSIIENIINPLKPDIFFSTWKNEDYDDFGMFYKPKGWTVLDQEATSFFDIFNFNVEPSPGLLPMLLGMKSVYKICTQNNKKKYDAIIRIRPDIQVLEQIKVHEIKDCIKNKIIRLPYFESDNIYNHEEEVKKEFSFSFVYDKASLPNQINDQIAVGHPDAMKKYMTCLDNYVHAVNLLWNEGYPEYMIKVPESVLTICLNLKNCRYKKLTGTNSFGNLNTVLCKDGNKWRNKGHHSVQLS